MAVTYEVCRREVKYMGKAYKKGETFTADPDIPRGESWVRTGFLKVVETPKRKRGRPRKTEVTPEIATAAEGMIAPDAGE